MWDGDSGHAQRVSRLLDKAEQALSDDMIPVDIFNDPDIFRAEMGRIFGRAWVFVAFDSEIPNPGDYVLRRIGLDPVLVTRDGNGELHVLSNYCRHRGAELCRTERGNASAFRCPYHGWTFRNDGEWIGAPSMKEAYGGRLDAKKWGLFKAPHVESYRGLIFASLSNDAPSLKEHLGGAAWALDMILGLHSGGMRVVAPPHRSRFDTDWKIPSENFAGDAYHLYVAHWSTERIGLSWGLEHACHVIETYEFENGHNFSGHAFADKVDPNILYGGTSPEVYEQFDFAGLDDLQRDLARRGGLSVGTIFPNLSFVRIVGQTAQQQQPTVYTSFRQWQPVAPGRIEFLNWFLVWNFMTAEQVQRSYDVGLYSAGVAGLFDQDDAAVWPGPAKAATSPWLRRLGAEFHLQMGRHSADRLPDPDWKGPGVHRKNAFGEQAQLSYYREWLRLMRTAA